MWLICIVQMNLLTERYMNELFLSSFNLHKLCQIITSDIRVLKLIKLALAPRGCLTQSDSRRSLRDMVSEFTN